MSSIQRISLKKMTLDEINRVFETDKNGRLNHRLVVQKDNKGKDRLYYIDSPKNNWWIIRFFYGLWHSESKLSTVQKHIEAKFTKFYQQDVEKNLNPDDVTLGNCLTKELFIRVFDKHTVEKRNQRRWLKFDFNLFLPTSKTAKVEEARKTISARIVMKTSLPIEGFTKAAIEAKSNNLAKKINCITTLSQFRESFKVFPLVLEAFNQFEKDLSPTSPPPPVTIDNTKADKTEIQKTLNTKNIPLTVTPVRVEEDYAMDRDKANYYLQTAFMHCTENKEEFVSLVQKAIDHVQYISMNEFEAVLEECILDLNKSLEENGQTDYLIGFTQGKSSQWVSSLALESLTHLPVGWLDLGSDQGTMRVNTPDTDFEREKVKQDNSIVLIDDCSYSGTQLINNLERIGLAAQQSENKKHVFIVMPYMTTLAKEKVEAFQKANQHIAVTLITKHKIKTISEIFSDQSEQELLRKIIVPFYWDFRHSLTSTLCYTNWRMPDKLSFLHGFGSYAMRFFEEGNTSICNWSEVDKYFIPQDIPRPYAIGSKTEHYLHFK